MCDACGCSATARDAALAFPVDGHAVSAVQVMRSLLRDNDAAAAHNRAHFDAHGLLAVNLMSSPGAGKTALLEATIDALRGELRLAVIEGDLETDRDARRIRAKGVPAVQITTGGACHLDAHMVHHALHELPLDAIDVLFIENVGNLVCPASFDLGQHRAVTLLSVAEGDDKPAKYPVMFRSADLIVLSKTDLLPHVGDFDPVQCERYVRELANPAPVLPLCARSGAGMAGWIDWLRGELRAQRAGRETGNGAGDAVQPATPVSARNGAGQPG